MEQAVSDLNITVTQGQVPVGRIAMIVDEPTAKVLEGVTGEPYRVWLNGRRFNMVPLGVDWPESLRLNYINDAVGVLALDQEDEPAVLYDLLPPEHRGDLVKAVFPGMESQRCEPQPPDLSKWNESPDCCEVWPRLLHGFGWFHLDERPDLLLMPFIEGRDGNKWRVNRCPACGADRVAVVVSAERKEASEP